MKKVLIAGLFFGLSGCSFAPTYTRPDLPTASQYQEKMVEDGHWVPFKATETSQTWWKVFHDPVLDDLEHSGLVANQNLLAALARLDQGRSLAREQWANLWPMIGAAATHQKTKISEHTMIFPVQNYPAFQTNQVQLDLNYELDIWGALRNAAHAADAQARASADDLATLALSTEAEIALDYESLRALDVELSETERQVNSWSDNRALTTVLVRGPRPPSRIRHRLI
ncbi:RND efflux system, outer membrane lipoprotein, NodT family [mine drainage metagenome]|uniref:RND efflux system, outer membrane lipoprotein, NodT family n=1 Tax=mine drainage metagenome TaxID=410659 RepID=T0Y223_9ZZZZ